MARFVKKLDLSQNNLKCYGRDDEILLLRNACNCLNSGSHANIHDSNPPVATTSASELILIEGVSGIGKTYMVETAYQLSPNMRNRIFFSSGKHSFQDASSTPFAALQDCLAGLVDKLDEYASTSSSDAAKIPENLKLSASDGLFLAETLLPHLKDELECICVASPRKSGTSKGGVIPPTSKQQKQSNIQSTNSLDRLAYAVRAIIKLACSIKPVVFFLDDVQWIGTESLKLLETALLHDTYNLKHKLVIVAAHRPLEDAVEANPSSPLRRFLQKLKEAHDASSSAMKISHTHLKLKELHLDSIQQLLANIFQREDSGVESLAKLVQRKTRGNAFFVKQFIQRLEERKLVHYSAACDWEWDETQILEQMPVSNQIADLIQNKFQTVSSEIQMVLQCAAILGMHRFDTETLFPTVQVVCDYVNEQSDDNINQSVEMRISSIETMCEILNSASQDGLVEMIYPWKYKFVHDRILESAAALLPQREKLSEIRQRVGSVFLEISNQFEQDTDHRKRDNYLLLAVHQLQQAEDGSTNATNDDAETTGIRLSRLHLSAAHIHIRRSAYFPALDHLQKSINLLGESNQGRWSDHYSIMLEACTVRAQMYLACGYPNEECRTLVDDILEHAISFQDKIAAYDCLVHLLTVQSAFEEALDVCLSILDDLDVPLPRRNHTFHVIRGIVRLKQKLRRKTDEELIGLPPMIDTHMIHALRILSQVVEAAFFAVKPTYLALAVIKQLNISMKYGSCDQTAEAFSHGAMLFGPIGDYESAFRIGQLGYELAKKEKTHHDGLAIFVTFYFVNHWQRPYNESLNPMMHAHHLMMDTGGFHKAWYPLIAYALLYYCCGLSLEPLARDLKKYADTMIDCGQKMHIQHTLPLQQMVLNFMGQSEDPLVLTGEAMDQEKFLLETKDVPRAQNEYHRCRMILAYYFGDLNLAEEMSQRMPSAAEEGSVAMLPLHFLYQGLIALGLARTTKKRKYRQQARVLTNQVRTWVKKGNPNCHHMLLLLRAETMSLHLNKNSKSRIKKEYDDAIASAARSGFLHHQALANERAATFFVMCDDQFWAALYFQNARDLYREYGAAAKAQHVQTLCSEYRLDVGASKFFRNSSVHFARERVPKRVSLLEMSKEKDVILEVDGIETLVSSLS